VNRLLLDEHFPPDLAAMLRERGFDVVAVAADPALRGAADPDLYAYARAAGRRIVTENVADFRLLQAGSFACGEEPAHLLLASAARHPRARRHLGRLATEIAGWLTRDDPPKTAEEWL
jgi:predicted nuclease of predicted toxin-antitoxin system